MHIAERFWQKVEKTSSCWLWIGALNTQGYGNFWDGTRYRRAHHVALELATGVPVPKDTVVLHICDNPRCVNPAHLQVGTQQDNIHDMIRKGRRGYTGLQGEKNPRAKLKPYQVREIRRLLDNGETRATVARRFRLGWTTVDRIMKRRSWKHI